MYGILLLVTPVGIKSILLLKVQPQRYYASLHPSPCLTDRDPAAFAFKANNALKCDSQSMRSRPRAERPRRHYIRVLSREFKDFFLRMSRNLISYLKALSRLARFWDGSSHIHQTCVAEEPKLRRQRDNFHACITRRRKQASSAGRHPLPTILEDVPLQTRRYHDDSLHNCCGHLA